MKRFPILAGLALALALAAAPLAAAESGANKRTARVARGDTVELADSSRTAAEWAERRPDWRALQPRRR